MSSISAPSPNWEFDTPLYRATRNIHPSPNRRHRLEPPFATMMDPDEWQFGTAPIKSGESVSTREWPHESFFPINHSATRVLQFFKTRTKSRLARAPWANGQIRLDDGLTGPTSISLKSGVVANG
jgi:hypothetical protein